MDAIMASCGDVQCSPSSGVIKDEVAVAVIQLVRWRDPGIRSFGVELGDERRECSNEGGGQVDSAGVTRESDLLLLR